MSFRKIEFEEREGEREREREREREMGTNHKEIFSSC
jgi:hypothetical protein